MAVKKAATSKLKAKTALKRRPPKQDRGVKGKGKKDKRGFPIVGLGASAGGLEALANLGWRAEEAGGRVEVGDLPLIEADTFQMIQLFQNLLSNALKFHKGNDAPVVKAYSRCHGDTYEICVEDNGIGFKEEYVERIFAPFERLHGGSRHKGVGMGLTICRKIAERHGGGISAKSEIGKGSIFTVTLPRRQC